MLANARKMFGPMLHAAGRKLGLVNVAALQEQAERGRELSVMRETAGWKALESHMREKREAMVREILTSATDVEAARHRAAAVDYVLDWVSGEIKRGLDAREALSKHE